MRTIDAKPLSKEQLRRIDAYWRAANYLSVGQIFLYDNPLLKKPMSADHIKPRLVGHWGTTPGLNLVYAHVNRLIVERDLSAIFVAGPGHGGPGVVANAYLEGTYSETYPDVAQDEAGMKRLFTQFAFPGGVGSHAGPEIPGSIHEGGELGYSLLHAYGAVLDSPGLLAVCVVGDGEAETGPLAASWHSNKFLNPSRDGAVLPILHLNGYKIANPTFLARIPEGELESLLRGCGYDPILVSGDDPSLVHQSLAAALDACALSIAAIQKAARSRKRVERPLWPMIVLRTPKGWTGPKTVGGDRVEGTFRAHQFRMAKMEPGERAKLLESWMQSYRPKELFDAEGRLKPELEALAPKGHRRMSANPHANGGLLLRNLRLPDFRSFAVKVPSPGAVDGEATVVQGRYLRDVLLANSDRFRIFGPDETSSNRLGAVYEADAGCLVAESRPGDENVSPDGRVMEVLSEQLCQGWLEGYLLTGRHGLFSCYEAFIRIVDSMASQHSKWLDLCRKIPWRRPIASLNYLLTSHVWRQDHNGFSHMEPGFLDHIINKRAEVSRIFLPPDANTLLCVVDACLRSHNCINVIVAGKQVSPQWLTMEQAVRHCAAGIGIWEWASTDGGASPDVVMACCGDVPTVETLAAVAFLRTRVPELKIRVVNVVDLMKLRLPDDDPRGLLEDEFTDLFTPDKPVIFAFHGYPGLIERLVHRRSNGRNFRCRGFKEAGTTTTPFDMVVLNEMDRWRLALDAIERVPGLAARAAYMRQEMRHKLVEHSHYISTRGDDMPEIKDWRWSAPAAARKRARKAAAA
jgi:xylulose-5-phosphate/fructose-6-phosphate phosphoketolase